MIQISPYVSFNGKCREAMSFYQECLGGELTLQTVAETPFAARCPEGMLDQIMHSMLTKDGHVIMGTDMVGPEGFTEGNNISVSINCSSEEEIRSLFSKLSQDGQILDDLKVQFWGGIFGVVVDKFGIRWMFNYEKSKQA